MLALRAADADLTPGQQTPLRRLGGLAGCNAAKEVFEVAVFQISSKLPCVLCRCGLCLDFRHRRRFRCNDDGQGINAQTKPQDQRNDV